MKESKTRVVIGMDPHKGSVTIEVMDGDEHILVAGTPRTLPATGRCSTTCAPGRTGLGDRGLQTASAGISRTG